MQRFRHTFLLLGTLFVLLATAACSGEDCPINNTVMGKMAFYNQKSEAVALISALTVKVVRPQGDSVVLNHMSKTSEVRFPLSYVHGTDTLIFDYGDGVTCDSLYVSHTNTPMLVSVDCGMAMYHSITSVASTHQLIDTLILKSSEVDYDERENIQVIYR